MIKPDVSNLPIRIHLQYESIPDVNPSLGVKRGRGIVLLILKIFPRPLNSDQVARRTQMPSPGPGPLRHKYCASAPPSAALPSYSSPLSNAHVQNAPLQHPPRTSFATLESVPLCRQISGEVENVPPLPPRRANSPDSGLLL
jgi:hypothetical protein